MRGLFVLESEVGDFGAFAAAWADTHAAALLAGSGRPPTPSCLIHPTARHNREDTAVTTIENTSAPLGGIAPEIRSGSRKDSATSSAPARPSATVTGSSPTSSARRSGPRACSA